MGNSLLFILIAIFGMHYHYSTTTIALFTSIYFAGQLAGTFICRPIIAQCGYIRSFAIFVTLFSVISLLLGYNILIIWTIARFISGMCMAGITVVLETWINDKADNNNRGQVLSVYMTIYYLALGLGQFLINIPFHEIYSYFILVDALLSLAIIPICMTKTPEPEPPQKIKISLISIYHKAPIGVIGIFVSGFANASFYGLAAIFAKNIGLSTAQISLFTGITIMGSFLIQWPLGKLSDIMGRRQIIMMISIIAILACASILVITHYHLPYILLYPMSILYGGVAFSLYSICSAYTNDLISPQERMHVGSSLIMVMASAAAIGPLITGRIMHHAPIMGLYSTILGLHVFLIIIVLFRQYQSPLPKKLRGKLQWVFVPYTSPVVAQVAQSFRNSRILKQKKKEQKKAEKEAKKNAKKEKRISPNLQEEKNNLIEEKNTLIKEEKDKTKKTESEKDNTEI